MSWQSCEGLSLCIGDRIKDNDPRMKARGILTIIRMDHQHVWARSASSTLEYRISRKRIHTDEKVRRSEFTRVSS